jgi:2-oxoglutarate ferredoxin oxidoreductase subunit delta
MKPRFFNRERSKTPFIQLNTRKCKACWKCIEDCPKQVISKIDLPWHKHVVIAEPVKCSGCLNCINVCQYGAFEKLDTR